MLMGSYRGVRLELDALVGHPGRRSLMGPVRGTNREPALGRGLGFNLGVGLGIVMPGGVRAERECGVSCMVRVRHACGILDRRSKGCG